MNIIVHKLNTNSKIFPKKTATGWKVNNLAVKSQFNNQNQTRKWNNN